jgi:hypothetical protein
MRVPASQLQYYHKKKKEGACRAGRLREPFHIQFLGPSRAPGAPGGWGSRVLSALPTWAGLGALVEQVVYLSGWVWDWDCVCQDVWKFFCVVIYSVGLTAPCLACPPHPLVCRPMLIDMNKVYRQTNLENLDQAFSVAERDLGVTRLLDPEGMSCWPLFLSLPQPCTGSTDPFPFLQMWTSLSPTRSPSSPTSRPCTMPCPECPARRMG